MTRGPAMRPDIVARLAKAANLPISTGDGYLFQTKLPGFKYDDFDRAGYVSMFKLLRLFETERPIFFRFMHLGPRPYQQPNEDIMMFGGHLQVSPELYHTAAMKQPMTMSLKFAGYGKTSLDWKLSLTSDETKTELASTFRRTVCVDLARSVSAPIPEAFVNEVLKPFIESNNIEPYRFPVLDTVSLPERHFVTNIEVMHDDLDCLFHLNQAVYAKYISNALAQAAASGFLKSFKHDVCFHQIKSVVMLHSGESFVGDQLKVCTWQDPDDDHLLFVIIRRADRDIYQAKVQFYEDSL